MLSTVGIGGANSRVGVDVGSASNRQVNCKIRVRDAVVGATACLLFGTATHYLGQQQILATVVSINFGLVAALASAHLWSPIFTRSDPPLT